MIRGTKGTRKGTRKIITKAPHSALPITQEQLIGYEEVSGVARRAIFVEGSNKLKIVGDDDNLTKAEWYVIATDDPGVYLAWVEEGEAL